MENLVDVVSYDDIKDIKVRSFRKKVEEVKERFEETSPLTPLLLGEGEREKFPLDKGGKGDFLANLNKKAFIF
ncbi:MAG: hypothetical protein LBC61_04450 [Candidatus Peribacteria bacterium]|nr:hypothetical protein [Candidatus Peribacteria bacterium]